MSTAGAYFLSCFLLFTGLFSILWMPIQLVLQIVLSPCLRFMKDLHQAIALPAFIAGLPLGFVLDCLWRWVEGGRCPIVLLASSIAWLCFSSRDPRLLPAARANDYGEIAGLILYSLLHVAFFRPIRWY
jgi:hypothetical protein